MTSGYSPNAVGKSWLAGRFKIAHSKDASRPKGGASDEKPTTCRSLSRSGHGVHHILPRSLYADEKRRLVGGDGHGVGCRANCLAVRSEEADRHHAVDEPRPGDRIRRGDAADPRSPFRHGQADPHLYCRWYRDAQTRLDGALPAADRDGGRARYRRAFRLRLGRTDVLFRRPQSAAGILGERARLGDLHVGLGARKQTRPVPGAVCDDADNRRASTSR